MKLAENSKYKIILTKNAKTQLEQILRYLRQNLKSEQAARNVKADIKNTETKLSCIADSLKLCDDDRLRSLGYRAIHLKHHRYFMLYKIVKERVYVIGIYHDLQDYENILR